jgi:acetyltransferase-like isoleucine patch superfamily enzyme
VTTDNFFKYLLKKVYLNWVEKWRTYLIEKRGLTLSPNCILRLPKSSECQLQFGQGCSVGNYTVIDICDDPSDNSLVGALKMGDMVYIGDNANIRAAGGSVEIGCFTMIANSVVIVAANHATSLGSPMCSQPWDNTRRGVTIGRDCWIGSNSTILPGSKIGDGVVIAAGSVVRGEVPAFSFYGGVPAKLLKMRT